MDARKFVVDGRELKSDAIIKLKGAKTWKLLLTTDLSLSFVKTMELYQIRWTIEVLFKECKQYLRLGKGQNTDFDGQIADTASTWLTHLILSLGLRFQAYETMGGLFRDLQNQMIRDTLHQRIMMAIVERLSLSCLSSFPLMLRKPLSD